MERLSITLDEKRAERLSRLAERTRVEPDEIALALLSIALDEADPEARAVVGLLDDLPGAYNRAVLGLGQAKAGQTILLDML